MSDKIIDKVFGEMEYKHRWYKIEKINFWSNDYEVRIVARAYSGEQIEDIQREQYLKFKENIVDISEASKNKVIEYINNNLDEIKYYWEEASYISEDGILDGIAIPKTVMFEQSGEVIILCDCVWDEEHGIGVRIFPNYEVGPQDMFL